MQLVWYWSHTSWETFYTTYVKKTFASPSKNANENEKKKQDIGDNLDVCVLNLQVVQEKIKWL